MNYYDARQRQDDKRWDYTCMNDGRIWPVGYCAHRIACECYGVSAEHGYNFEAKPDCEQCGGTGHVDSPDYCGGHDDEEGARECFARYLLDGWREEEYGDWTGCEYRVDKGLDDFGATHREKCDTPTKKGLTTRPPLGHGFALCDEHRTFECLRFLAPHTIGQITASY